MKRIDLSLPGVFVIEPAIFRDNRGFFLESYHEEKFRALGVEEAFVQDNHSSSTRHTLRGLHYQLRQPQAKLCRVVRGEVLDVAVDIRRGSPTFGQWTSTRLSAETHRQVYIPAGFAHGFLVLSETAEFLYKCSAFYDPEDQHGIAWDDPQLAIDWSLTAAPHLSAKDSDSPRLAELDRSRLPVYAAHPAHLLASASAARARLR
jgi:dTDP-4-dehydrorhamnose 3,5-epimerase